MILILFSLIKFTQSDNENPTRSHTPYATSKSGVPSMKIVFLTCGIAFLIILFIVSILCIIKTKDNESIVLHQALLEKADY